MWFCWVKTASHSRNSYVWRSCSTLKGTHTPCDNICVVSQQRQVKRFRIRISLNIGGELDFILKEEATLFDILGWAFEVATASGYKWDEGTGYTPDPDYWITHSSDWDHLLQSDSHFVEIVQFWPRSAILFRWNLLYNPIGTSQLKTNTCWTPFTDQVCHSCSSLACQGIPGPNRRVPPGLVGFAHHSCRMWSFYSGRCWSGRPRWGRARVRSRAPPSTTSPWTRSSASWWPSVTRTWWSCGRGKSPAEQQRTQTAARSQTVWYKSGFVCFFVIEGGNWVYQKLVFVRSIKLLKAMFFLWKKRDFVDAAEEIRWRYLFCGTVVDCRCATDNSLFCIV